eukprot:TRINITY_DN5321_c0_g1_i3.p1 TRINITY_DN5321_c0_g1~~TRINITY_DN5321_c0_g1_i3.p1  ORF type:complete len:214 (+),score=51.84 TRINITY_DN5321_c0_g1_i3:75-644(+)
MSMSQYCQETQSHVAYPNDEANSSQEQLCERAAKKYSRRQVTATLRKKCCDHNDWDNVRVAKGLMTLRCRACQKQWRAAVDMVWGRLKCANFGSEEGCSDKPCSKLHIHNRKLSLEARVRQHGGGVLNMICTSRVTKETLNKIKKIEEQMSIDKCVPHIISESSGSSKSRSSSNESKATTFTHDPYAWE